MRPQYPYFPSRFFVKQCLGILFVITPVALFSLPVAYSLAAGAAVNLLVNATVARATFRYPPHFSNLKAIARRMLTVQLIKLLTGGVMLGLIATHPAFVVWAVLVGYLLPIVLMCFFTARTLASGA